MIVLIHFRTRGCFINANGNDSTHPPRNVLLCGSDSLCLIAYKTSTSFPTSPFPFPSHLFPQPPTFSTQTSSKKGQYLERKPNMCVTIYQTYSNCDCFLVEITYCYPATRLIGNTCPVEVERIMQFPFKCGTEECPRLETSLRFESEVEDQHTNTR